MHVLVAEDDAVSRRILEASLRRWGHEVTAVDNGYDAWRILSGNNPPRIAVIDWMMPGLDGPEVCERLRQREGHLFTFILILTAKDNTEDIVAALNAGADDYLTKPYHPQELRSRLDAGIRIVNLTLELEKANRKLYDAAHTDFLTRIPNRSAILSRLTDQISRSDRSHTGFVVVLADIDFFKKFNDEFGHKTGDAVLIQVAERLSGCKREYDAVGRYGGEEFLIVLDDVEEADAYAVAERFRRRVCEKPIECDSRLHKLTMSFGALWVPPDHGADVDELLHHADLLLYQAKGNGRARSVSGVFGSESGPAAAQNE
jgi:two-component system cell cycle response regulator